MHRSFTCQRRRCRACWTPSGVHSSSEESYFAPTPTGRARGGGPVAVTVPFSSSKRGGRILSGPDSAKSPTTIGRREGRVKNSHGSPPYGGKSTERATVLQQRNTQRRCTCRRSISF